jgi:peptidoglycan/LPS O-acetylase OafA/YrhL
MTNARINQSQSAFLDATRYVLASVVVFGHGFGFFLNYFDGFIPGIFPHPQSIAVVCFFYLSGYLIVGSQLGGN